MYIVCVDFDTVCTCIDISDFVFSVPYYDSQKKEKDRLISNATGMFSLSSTIQECHKPQDFSTLQPVAAGDLVISAWKNNQCIQSFRPSRSSSEESWPFQFQSIY